MRRPAMHGCATGSERSCARSSIGPGATNMLTGAALATVNRLPVLLLPVTSSPRAARPRAPAAGGPVGRRRVGERLLPARLALLRPDLAARASRPGRAGGAASARNQAETGAVTLAFPQDVQTEAFDFPEAFLAKRVWHIPRPLPDDAALARAAALIRARRATADRRRRRCHLLRGDRRAARASASGRASRSARRRPARAPCPTTIRPRSVRSA